MKWNNYNRNIKSNNNNNMFQRHTDIVGEKRKHTKKDPENAALKIHQYYTCFIMLIILQPFQANINDIQQAYTFCWQLEVQVDITGSFEIARDDCTEYNNYQMYAMSNNFLKILRLINRTLFRFSDLHVTSCICLMSTIKKWFGGEMVDFLAILTRGRIYIFKDILI